MDTRFHTTGQAGLLETPQPLLLSLVHTTGAIGLFGLITAGVLTGVCRPSTAQLILEAETAANRVVATSEAAAVSASSYAASVGEGVRYRLVSASHREPTSAATGAYSVIAQGSRAFGVSSDVSAPKSSGSDAASGGTAVYTTPVVSDDAKVGDDGCN